MGEAMCGKIPYILLFTMTLISLYIYYLKFYSYIFLVIFAAIGSMIFIIIDRFSIEDNSTFYFDLSDVRLNRLRLVTSILFFLFIGLSLLELLNGFYTKTTLYYIYISLCAGLIAVEILFIRTEKQGAFNLIKSFLLALNITLSNQILYPKGIGLPDLVIHLNQMVIPIVNSGYVPTSVYQYFPCHHILVAASILICHLDPKMMYLYLGGFLISSGIFFIFIIGRKFVDLQFGLFSSLIYTCLDYLLMYGSHPIHQSYNYFLSVLLFSIILYIFNNRTPRFVILYILVIISIVFTHHLSAIITLFLLASIEISEFLSNTKFGFSHKLLIGSGKTGTNSIIGRNKNKFLRTVFTVTRSQNPKSNDPDTHHFTLFRLFVIVLLGQWIYYSQLFNSFVGILQAYNAAFTHSGQSLMTPMAYDQISRNTIFINSLGSSILIFFAVIGFLYFIRRMSFFRRSVIISTILLAFLLLIGILYKQVGLLPDRIYPFLQLFGLVFMASGGVQWILNRKIIKKQNLKFVSVIFLIACLSFFSCSSTIAGFETSPFTGNEISYYKLYDTPQESLSNHWISQYVSTSNVQFNLTIEDTGKFDTANFSANSVIVLNKFYFFTGFVKGIGVHMGQIKFIRIPENEASKLVVYDKYYSNGMIELSHTN